MATKKKDWSKVVGAAEEPEAKPEKSEKPEKKAAGIEHPEYKELEDSLTAAEQKGDEYRNEVLRLKAEIENMQRRSERDVANAHKYGLEKFATELLPVMDSLEHGLASCESADGDELYKNIQSGMQLTRDMLMKTLEKFKIEQVDPQGQPFNPEHHEAMSTQNDPKAKPNTVLRVFQKGYLLNGRLIRPALVIVAKK